MLARLRAAFTAQIAEKQWDPSQEAQSLSCGPGTPAYRDLIFWPPALYALHALGFREVKWWGAATIPKPPGEGRRSYHQDWWGWQFPESVEPKPMQVGLLYYLSDTGADTGALTVVPGSHCQRVPLHGQANGADPLGRVGYLYDHAIARAPAENEVIVSVRAGDLVILDARALHAACAHHGPEIRMLLTLWYMVDFTSLPEPVQQFVTRSSGPLRDFLGPLAPDYHGRAPACQQNCIPIWSRS